MKMVFFLNNHNNNNNIIQLFHCCNFNNFPPEIAAACGSLLLPVIFPECVNVTLVNSCENSITVCFNSYSLVLSLFLTNIFWPFPTCVLFFQASLYRVFASANSFFRSLWINNLMCSQCFTLSTSVFVIKRPIFSLSINSRTAAIWQSDRVPSVLLGTGRLFLFCSFRFGTGRHVFFSLRHFFLLFDYYFFKCDDCGIVGLVR